MPEQLSMRTAKCEGCGCTWDNACLVVGPQGRHGCSWDPEMWKKGRAVCSLCTKKVPA